tara:strand:+ start:37 stop:456 length:420 start_codon:yes stop_codon:yes gene_type:complete
MKFLNQTYDRITPSLNCNDIIYTFLLNINRKDPVTEQSISKFIYEHNPHILYEQIHNIGIEKAQSIIEASIYKSIKEQDPNILYKCLMNINSIATNNVIENPIDEHNPDIIYKCLLDIGMNTYHNNAPLYCENLYIQSA